MLFEATGERTRRFRSLTVSCGRTFPGGCILRSSMLASIVGIVFLTFVFCASFTAEHGSEARHIDNGFVTNIALLSRKFNHLVKDAVIISPHPKFVFRTFPTSNPAYEPCTRTDSPSIIISCRAPPVQQANVHRG